MEFRLNFFIRTIIYFVWASLAYAGIFIIYSHVNTIGNWDKEEMLLLVTVAGFANTIHKATLYPNVNEIPRYIREGKMDFVLSMPVDARFLVSTRYFKFEQIPRLLVYLLLLIKFTFDVNPHTNITTAILPLILILIGVFGMYCLLFTISCIVFWKPRIWNLFAIINEIENLADRPSDIFRGLLWFVVNLLPIAAFATIPTKFLLGEGNINLFFSSVLVVSVVFILSQMIWKWGLKRYESASS
ncbi:ABC-2 family transporter protein [Candidatus Dojkabacteria bacterium]|nr:ABC-2 family transporter protein [Candidatus Dojkabacteria bacterium]